MLITRGLTPFSCDYERSQSIENNMHAIKECWEPTKDYIQRSKGLYIEKKGNLALRHTIPSDFRFRQDPLKFRTNIQSLEDRRGWGKENIVGN